MLITFLMYRNLCLLSSTEAGAHGRLVEDWFDVECLKECAAEADERVSLAEVRAALTKIPGSLTADFIAERDERF